jgi:hypothetical protein
METVKNLQLAESKARILFPTSPQWFKEILIQSFGEKCLKGSIMERVKTFVDAYDLASDAIKLEYKSSVNPNTPSDILAYAQLKVIIAVINEGWTPNWDNSNQKKWYPYFRLSSGFGFSGAYYGFTGTGTIVGSRLCLESQEKAEYVGKQFVELYKQFML